MNAVQKHFQEFLHWSGRREIRRLGNDWKVWFCLRDSSKQSALRQQWAQLSDDGVNQFVSFLAQQLTPDGLYIASTDLFCAFRNPTVNLTAHQEQLDQALKQCFKCHPVVPWEERVGVQGIFIPPGGKGEAEDVKQVRAFIVPGRGRQGQPKVYALNFKPDARCQDAMNRAAQIFSPLFAWWRMALVLLWSVLGNNPWTNLRTVLPEFAELWGVLRRAREVLKGGEIYLQIEGADSGLQGPSIFGSAFVAILLALGELSQDVKPRAIPLLVQRVVDNVKQKDTDFAISSAGTETGRLKAIGKEEPKKNAARKAGVKCLIFPRERERADNQDQKQKECASSEPEGSQMAAQRKPLHATGALEVRRYWHVWGVILKVGGLWHWSWFAVNNVTMMLILLLALFFAWPYLFQTAIISGGRSMAGGEFITIADKHLYGEAMAQDVLTIDIKANNYWPPLQFEIEAATIDEREISGFAPVFGKGDYDGTLTLQVEFKGVQFHYQRYNLPSRAEMQDPLVMTVRNFYGKLLDENKLILTLMR